MSQATRGSALEVVLSWAGAPERAELFPASRTPIVVGEGADATFLLPREVVSEDFILAEIEGSDWHVRIPASATARLEALDASGAPRVVDLATIPCDSEGVRRVRFVDGMRADVELGAFTFHVRTTEAPEKPAMAPVRFDSRAYGWLGASVAVHLALLGSMLLMPPDGHALSMDLTHDQARMIQYRLAGLVQEPPEPLPVPQQQGNEQNGTEGSPAPGESGTVGDENHHEHHSGVAVRGDRDRQVIPRTAEQMRQSGLLGALASLTASMHEISSPYGAEQAIGMADRDLYGLTGDPGIGEGHNGLDMIGVGHGGGCAPGSLCTNGTMGVGDLATVGGRGTCTPAEFDRISATEGRAAAAARCGGLGPASGTQISGPPPRSHGPRMRTLPPETIGGLTREQVRRVVTLHRNEVSYCYERALIGHPDLAGRVSVQFVVQASGAVQMSVVDQSSTLNHTATEQCVASAVRHWSFPQSAGVTAVTYPFLFEHAEQ